MTSPSANRYDPITSTPDSGDKSGGKSGGRSGGRGIASNDNHSIITPAPAPGNPQDHPGNNPGNNHGNNPGSNPADVPGTLPPPAQEFFNRELSWLGFNERVLHEALDPRTPLLERMRFLGIFTSNLDEFFMKRVGGLKRQLLAGVGSVSIDGRTPSEQLREIRRVVIDLQRRQGNCYTDEILPGLREHRVHLLSWRQLTPHERAIAGEYFRRNVFPVATPFAVDPGHPFPFISNLSVSLGVRLAHREQHQNLFARVKVPEVFPRWVRLEPQPDTPDTSGSPGSPGSETYRFVSLLDIVRHHLDMLFPGMRILTSTPFRVTRNADIDYDDDDSEDLLEMIENELRQRRFASIVRLEHGPNPDPWILHMLMDELEIDEHDIYELPDPLDYRDLTPIVDLPLPSLKFEPWTPVIPSPLSDAETEIFPLIRNTDMLVHHPYESFSGSVERFISTAAADPKVLAIKLTLYRIGDSKPLMDTLIRAAELGKQVVCLVELKARFDEQRNIYWAQQLEQAGIKVVYGIVGLKTHTKLALVVRQESDRVRCYAHIGTGNYNAQTAKLYTDLGLFTARESITQEVVELFHYLTGRSLKSDYRHLLVAPMTMRQRFMEMIDREIENHRQGRPARIVAKMNSLEDRRIIRHLYHASRCGVEIDLIIRGFCCLRPGVRGMSDRIRVTSVIGRFLEHSRIFYFRDAATLEPDGAFFIGSADWMYRNLSHRVELITPVIASPLRQRLWDILNVMLEDHRQCWDLQPDGTYTQRAPRDPRDIGTHRTLMHSIRPVSLNGSAEPEDTPAPEATPKTAPETTPESPGHPGSTQIFTNTKTEAYRNTPERHGTGSDHQRESDVHDLDAMIDQICDPPEYES